MVFCEYGMFVGGNHSVIVRVPIAAEGDERDPLRELLGMFLSEREARARMRIRSELTWQPPTDVIETEEEIVVVVDIAGMAGDDIAVVTDGSTLKISGTRRYEAASGMKQFHQLEIQVGPFERTVQLPARVDPDKVSAHYDKGLLTVRIGKINPSECVKRVKID
jgi:HSP20 family protein